MNVHIERLVLDVVDLQRSQSHLLQAAFETELARLLTEGGLAPLLSSGGAVARLTTPDIQINRSNGPTDLGKSIAGAVYGGIGR